MADETLLAEKGESETTATTEDQTQTGQTTTEQQTATGAETKAETTTETQAVDFNKDWRTALSKGEPDLLKFLGRYTTPDAAIKQLKTLNDDIKAGKYKKPLGEDATDEEKAAYRKEQGIPDAADGYFETLPQGLVIGDDDKPNVTKFMAKMHEAGAKPGEVNAALESYYDIVQAQAEEQADLAAATKQDCEDALTLEWGADKKRNLNVVKSFVASLPSGVGTALANGFVPREDGKMVPIGNSPEVVKWLAGLALEANPLATVVPGAGANQASAIADEIGEIEKVMRTNRSVYNKDEKMQARYRELIDAQLKIKEKS